MRELKFRAWDKVQKKMWRDGIHISMNGSVAATFGIWSPSTALVLEQYTGLKDGQGHEIYEGDVVEDYMSDAPPVVVSLDPEGHFIFDQFEYKGFMELVARGRIQIIGNIHENPGLIPK